MKTYLIVLFPAPEHDCLDGGLLLRFCSFALFTVSFLWKDFGIHWAILCSPKAFDTEWLGPLLFLPRHTWDSSDVPPFIMHRLSRPLSSRRIGTSARSLVVVLPPWQRLLKHLSSRLIKRLCTGHFLVKCGTLKAFHLVCWISFLWPTFYFSSVLTKF